MMKRILFILVFLCVLDFAAMGQGAPPLRIREADGSPSKLGISTIVVTNGTLTISGTTATIVTGGGGGGGSPGGSTTQVQYNDTGAFAGAAGFTFNGTSTVTLGVAGTSVGAIAFKNVTSGTITLQPVAGALGTVTLSLPAATDTLVGLAATQTLTNKTLTAPVIATISNTGTLTLPTSTDTLVGKATTDTFTNKTLTASSNVIGGVTMTLGSDADGDIYYRASNVLTRLPKGTAGQVLTMNGGATAPEWAAGGGGGGLTVGTTTITSGTTTRVLYNNAGVVGEYAVTGTGNAVLSASPTLTGRISAADGLFATSVTTGTGATAGLNVTANSLTTGNGADLSSSSVTSGNVVSIAATGTAAASNTKTALNVATSGANATSTMTTYGAQISNTSTGTSSTNIALQLTASGGATANTALNVTAGQILSGLAYSKSITAFGPSASPTSGISFSSGGFYYSVSGTSEFAITGSAGVVINGSRNLSFASGQADAGGLDTIIRRAAAANLAHGAADAASPVAQIDSRQGVVAGTSNTNGVDQTYTGSVSTGTGNGGGFIWQTSPAGGSGTSQNALVTAFTINSAGHFIAGGTAPTITSGFGTSPSIAGTDQGGRVTVGTGGIATTGVVTFGKAFATAPACTVNNETTVLLAQATATTTTLTITSATPFTAADKLTYTCVGY